MTSELVGMAAVASAGRESGRTFIVVGGSDVSSRVYISDGKHRRKNSPKLKGTHHLRLLCIVPGMAERLRDGSCTDRDIRRAVYAVNEAQISPKGESNAEG